MPLKGVAADMNEIMISARSGRETGMKIVAHPLYPMHRYIPRQHAIEPIGKLRFINNLLDIEMSYHLAGMHTRIRTTGTRYLYRSA